MVWMTRCHLILLILQHLGKLRRGGIDGKALFDGQRKSISNMGCTA